jgi:pSer/pThr/pTyr-binding forkhead associated (FHA) protein
MASKWVLRCLSAPLLRLDLERTVMILGRATQCDLVVDDPSISRRHAELRIRGARLLLTDLESRNGTFVDGNSIKAAELSPGQQVRFGTVAFGVQAAHQPVERDKETDDPWPAFGAKGSARAPGGEVLSEAQRRVFELILTGSSEKAIAQCLNLSPHTVHTHVQAILRISGFHTRLELLAAISGNGIERKAEGTQP